MRYHILSLRLFHSFSIIFQTCESTSSSFSWLRQSGISSESFFTGTYGYPSRSFVMANHSFQLKYRYD